MMLKIFTPLKFAQESQTISKKINFRYTNVISTKHRLFQKFFELTYIVGLFPYVGIPCKRGVFSQRLCK